jgi:hypothetical protein
VERALVTEADGGPWPAAPSSRVLAGVLAGGALQPRPGLHPGWRRPRAAPWPAAPLRQRPGRQRPRARVLAFFRSWGFRYGGGPCCAGVSSCSLHHTSWPVGHHGGGRPLSSGKRLAVLDHHREQRPSVLSWMSRRNAAAVRLSRAVPGLLEPDVLLPPAAESVGGEELDTGASASSSSARPTAAALLGPLPRLLLLSQPRRHLHLIPPCPRPGRTRSRTSFSRWLQLGSAPPRPLRPRGPAEPLASSSPCAEPASARDNSAAVREEVEASGRRRAAREALDGDPRVAVAPTITICAEEHRLAFPASTHAAAGRAAQSSARGCFRESELAPASSPPFWRPSQLASSPPPPCRPPPSVQTTTTPPINIVPATV